MLSALLPPGGNVTVLCEAFFDESGSHEGAAILCLAGYIFKKNEAIKLWHEWRKVLHWKKLPYFHMVDCGHGNGPFANLSKNERVAVQTKLIEAIKQTRHSGHRSNRKPGRVCGISWTTSDQARLVRQRLCVLRAIDHDRGIGFH